MHPPILLSFTITIFKHLFNKLIRPHRSPVNIFSASLHFSFACYDTFFHPLSTDISKPEHHMATRWTLHSENWHFTHQHHTTSIFNTKITVTTFTFIRHALMLSTLQRENTDSISRDNTGAFLPETVGSVRIEMWWLAGCRSWRTQGTISTRFLPFPSLSQIDKSSNNQGDLDLFAFSRRVSHIVPHLILKSKITPDWETVRWHCSSVLDIMEEIWDLWKGT